MKGQVLAVVKDLLVEVIEVVLERLMGWASEANGLRLEQAVTVVKDLFQVARDQEVEEKEVEEKEVLLEWVKSWVVVVKELEQVVAAVKEA